MVMGRAKIPVKYDMFLEPKDLEGNKTLIIILEGAGRVWDPPGWTCARR